MWIAIGVVVALAVFFAVYFAKLSADKHERTTQMEQFFSYLAQNGFKTTDIIGGSGQTGVNNYGAFYMDSNNKKWCKAPVRHIYDFSDLKGAEIDKHTHSETKNKHTYKKYTYDVLIKTTDISNALVVICCGESKQTAERLHSTVKNIISTEKALNKLRNE